MKLRKNNSTKGTVLDRQEFRNTFNKEINKELQSVVRTYVDQRFESFDQLLRYCSAIDRKYESDELLQQGLPNLLNNMEGSILSPSSPNLFRRYLTALDEVVSSHPEEVQWPQKDDRFEVREKDQLYVRFVKKWKKGNRAILRVLYTLGHLPKGIFEKEKKTYPKWKQRIPLKNVLLFHLTDVAFIRKVEYRLERLQFNIIRDLELSLVEADEKKALDLSAFASDQKEKLGNIKTELVQEIEEGFADINAAVIESVEKTGTLEQRASYFSKQRIQQLRDVLTQQHEANINQWQRAERLYLNRTQDVARFQNFKRELEEKVSEFKETFAKLFKEALGQTLDELAKDIEQSIQLVKERKSLAQLRSVREKLASFVQQRLIESVRKLEEKRILSDKTEHFFEDLLRLVGQSPQEAQLIFDADLKSEPPIMNERKVEWQQLVSRALKDLLMNPIQPSKQQYEAFLAESLQEIREIENIISINLESALKAEDNETEEQEDPSKVAVEALQRILKKVEKLSVEAEEKWQQIEQGLEAGKKEFFSSLLALLHQGDSKQLQLLNAKYAVKEKTKDWQTVWDSRRARVEDKLMLWSRFIWKKGRDLGSNVQHFLGFKEEQVQESQRADIATYLSETDKQLKRLPYIYRRLFDFKSLADRRFFEPAKESTITFKKALDQWQQKLPANFAVVGEKGSGKSSFLNLMGDAELKEKDLEVLELHETIWQEQQLVNKLRPVLQVDHGETIEELITKVNGRDRQKVVVLESVQNCFVRNINGFEAIEKLAYLITETRERIFWIVSCSQYAWFFLDKVMQISEYFSHISKSDSLSAEQIEKIIVRRHQASGYSMYFEADEQTIQSRTYRKLKDREEEVQEHLRKQYFEKLTKLAEGNPSIAMIFWIRSIRDFDDTTFYIQPLEVTSVEMLESLNPQVLFTLAAFVLHDTLSDRELAMVLDSTVEESRLLINRLRSRGILVEKDNASTINHLMYRQIVRVLKDRNIIHLG